MPHFFVPPERIQGERFTLAADESHHLTKVLRKKPGDDVNLFDGRGKLYRGRLETVGDGPVTGRIVSSETQPALPLTLRLFQGLPKGDKFEWILEKMTELGATEIVPVHSERCVARLAKEKVPARLERWAKILTAAAKQSGRAAVPSVRAPMSLDEALAACGNDELTLFPWEGEKTVSLREILQSRLKSGKKQTVPSDKPGTMPLGMASAGGTMRSPSPVQQAGTLPGGNAATVNIFIGPEGGFSLDEVARAQRAGAITVTLGPAILRTETAGLFVASALLYETTQGVSE